jgi:hypothetical protein
MGGTVWRQVVSAVVCQKRVTSVLLCSILPLATPHACHLGQILSGRNTFEHHGSCHWRAVSTFNNDEGRLRYPTCASRALRPARRLALPTRFCFSITLRLVSSACIINSIEKGAHINVSSQTAWKRSNSSETCQMPLAGTTTNSYPAENGS